MKITGKMIFPLIYGKWNLPFIFSLAGSIKTPAQTNTKAKIVPILVKSRMNVLSVNNIGIPTTIPVTIVAKEGVLYFGCTVWNF